MFAEKPVGSLRDPQTLTGGLHPPTQRYNSAIPNEPSLSQRPTIALFTGFLLTGVVAVLLGPILPQLAADWDVPESRLASLFLVQFLASSVGAVLSSRNLRRSLVAGYALMAAGLAGLLGGWPVARLAVASLGAGLGLVIPASNLYLAHAVAGSRGAALSRLNLIWGLGAVACPLLVAVAIGRSSLTVLYGALAGASALAALALAVTVRPDDGGDETTEAEPSPDSLQAPARATLPTLVAFAVMFFLYVGAETAVAGWLVTLADKLDASRPVLALVIGSGFWGAVLVGRFVAPRILARIPEGRLFQTGLVIAILGTVLLTRAATQGQAAAGAVLTGLGVAPLYPLLVSFLAEATRADRSRRTGWVLAAGGAGGAVLPWVMGRLAGSGELTRAFWIPAAALLVLGAVRALRNEPRSG